MKKILFLLSVAIFIVMAATFTSCKDNVIPDIEYIDYISGYTGGLLRSNSSIKIELTNPVDGVEPNTEIAKNLFSFSPSMKGKAYWVNNQTIEFIPHEGQLKKGVVYKAKFKLGEVVKVEKQLKNFSFTFKVE
ncbi:MAG: hypothetical protein LBU51_07095, partial [Bacteroidales bacterium]|nr:hypothetical protein [Bacteroidales bacterium]